MKRYESGCSKLVMPALVAGIHVLAAKEDVDSRVKPGHDDGEVM